ncbi:hypothetical protein [Saccharopolyspora griseoalba]|uniref:Uncharacterized protein n=1 Tax=Saccharopolyspora griseoalba TaxID=1431848 RepID=A0ABW2LDP3_9PSEU
MFGLSAHWMLHEGEPVASVAVLSHEEQRERLRGYCPEAEPVALVAGDPCFDRMLAGRPLRESYRHRFGIRPEQRCVVVSSTWGPESLFGRDPSLVQRLSRELPLDEYRVVVALHPNVWHGHSPWQVRTWLADCAKAGALVLPPEEGWRAALIAADVTVGDHSSVGFYSAALGTPLLLASWPVHAVDPASPVAALLRATPRLSADRPLRAQIDEVVEQHTPDRHAEITALTTSVPERSAELLRAEIYSRMQLPEPPEPAGATAVPLPEQQVPDVPSQLVEVDWANASVVRHPASALGEVDGVLVAGTREPERRWLELAEVVLDDACHEDPLHWIRSTLAAMPGCVLGTTRDRCGTWVVTGRDHPVVRLRLPPDLGAAGAAVVHEWLRLGRPEFPARLHLGRRVVELGEPSRHRRAPGC